MKKISEALDGFFETYGIQDEKNYLGFAGAWAKLIGQDLSCHSRPSDIRGTVLIIAVDHPGWMTKIRFEEKKLVKKIAQSFPQLGITALAYSLVDKLPKPASLMKEAPVSLVNQETDQITGEQVVDKLSVSPGFSESQINEGRETNSDFQIALKKLKAAMAQKSRNDR